MRKTIHEAIAEMSDEEKKIYKNRSLGEEKEKEAGIRLTFFFPDGYELEPISVRAYAVPREGEAVSVRAYSLPEDPQHDYSRNHVWKVKRVWWVLNTEHKLKNRLLYPNRLQAEVHLEKVDETNHS